MEAGGWRGSKHISSRYGSLEASSDIAAFPDSVNSLEGVCGDVRTPDKLIDQVNDTSDGRHMWLAPILPGLVGSGGSRPWVDGDFLSPGSGTHLPSRPSSSAASQDTGNHAGVGSSGPAVLSLCCGEGQEGHLRDTGEMKDHMGL